MSNYFKAFIRVVKSINNDNFYNTFGSENIIEERLIIAHDKEEVKQFLLKKYPQFFPNNKIYSRENKDIAQFFYVVIFELYDYEKKQLLESTAWICDYCGQNHKNTYLSRPRMQERLFGDKKFCKNEEDYCISQYKKDYYKNSELPDDDNFIKKDSPIYIYKITEKSSTKCYVGKTKNAPFFRWWNHLTHSCSPFGIHLRQTKLSDWSFEVLQELSCYTTEKDVLRIESEYIKQFNSIQYGFNTLISNKDVMCETKN